MFFWSLSPQGVNIWQDVLPAAHGHAPVPLLPDAQARVRREGRRHQGRHRHRKTGHRVEDQLGRAGTSADQPAAEDGTPQSTRPNSTP